MNHTFLRYFASFCFFYVGTPSGVLFFGHLLWPISGYIPVGQSLLRVLFQGVSLLHGLLWSTGCVEPRLYAAPFKLEFNQLLIFIEKLSSLPGFEPRNSPVPSRYATNWAFASLFIYTIKTFWPRIVFVLKTNILSKLIKSRHHSRKVR